MHVKFFTTCTSYYIVTFKQLVCIFLSVVFVSEPRLKKEYCGVQLNDAKFKAFVYAIENHYWYQMYIGKGGYSFNGSVWDNFYICR